MSLYSQDDKPKRKSSTLHDSDHAHEDHDLLSGFDPQTDLTADGEVTFDLPVEPSLGLHTPELPPLLQDAPLTDLERRRLQAQAGQTGCASAITRGYLLVFGLVIVVIGYFTVMSANQAPTTVVRESQSVTVTQSFSFSQTYSQSSTFTLSADNTQLVASGINPADVPLCDVIPRAADPAYYLRTRVNINEIAGDLFRVTPADGSVCRVIAANTHALDFDIAPAGDQVAFVAFDATAGINRLYRMAYSSADSSTLTRLPLTRDTYDMRDIAWSPDAKRIAFTAVVDDQTDLFLYVFDGGGIARVTNDAVLESDPTWSPDGRLAYIAHNRDDAGFTEILLHDFKLNSARVIASGIQLSRLLWARDPDTLAYVDGEGIAANLRLIDVNERGADDFSREEIALTGTFEGMQPVAWSPDSRMFALLPAGDDISALYLYQRDTLVIISVLLPDWMGDIAAVEW